MRLSRVLMALCVTVSPVLAGDRSSPAEPPRAEEARASEMTTAPDFTFRKNIEEVQVSFVVAGSDGAPVMDVRSQDLQIFDNSIRVRDVTAFARDSESALNMVVLLDSSASLSHVLPIVSTEIVPRLRALLRTNSDHLSLATFDSRLQTIVSVDTPEALDVAATHHLLAKGPTAMYDTLVDLCGRDLWASPEASVRRTLLLVSDGEDNLSYHTLGQALASCNKAGITIFAIQPGKNPGITGRDVLQTLAEETGGQYFQIGRGIDVEQALTSIIADLRTRYSLVYRPAHQARSGYHEIRIIPAQRNWTIRARAGYFANSH